MKRVANPGALVLYQGHLFRVVAIGEGRTITMESVDAPTCPTCGRTEQVELLEHSSLFQEQVRPVETVTEA